MQVYQWLRMNSRDGGRASGSRGAGGVRHVGRGGFRGRAIQSGRGWYAGAGSGGGRGGGGSEDAELARLVDEFAGRCQQTPPEEDAALFGDGEPATSGAAWVPAPGFQRLSVSQLDDNGADLRQPYTLFFPLELTGKDYQRRVLELTAKARFVAPVRCCSCFSRDCAQAPGLTGARLPAGSITVVARISRG